MVQGSPLGTLAALEARLEEAIAAAGKLPPELVETTEHARQKERRQVSARNPVPYLGVWVTANIS